MAKVEGETEGSQTHSVPLSPPEGGWEGWRKRDGRREGRRYGGRGRKGENENEYCIEIPLQYIHKSTRQCAAQVYCVGSHQSPGKLAKFVLKLHVWSIHVIAMMAIEEGRELASRERER